MNMNKSQWYCRVRTAILAASVLLLLTSIEFTSNSRAQRNRQLTQPDAVETQTTGRVALVIGNSAYRYVPPLQNPVNDARDMRDTLKALGFEVLFCEDCSHSAMKSLISDFGERLRLKKSIGIFYYAGHGIQVSGHNYLIPVDVQRLREKAISYETVDVGEVIAEMDDAGNNLNIVILDACRRNPFSQSWRNAGDGLASMSAPQGMLVAYATLPNKVADDGEERNGVYTRELLRQLKTPGVEVEELFRRVRERVWAATGGVQTPSVTTNLVGRFYFNGIAENVAKPTPVSAPVSRAIPRGKSLSPGAYGTFSFVSLALNSRGEVLNQWQQQAKSFVDNVGGISLDMVEIPGGTFYMGTGEQQRAQLIQEYARNLIGQNDSEEDKAAARAQALRWVRKEMPQHFVSVNRFFMGKYEVTQQQWRIVARQPRVQIDLPLNPSKFKGLSLPVEQITWEQAVEFCARLSIATGRQYRLPSEAEWEYAARAGTTTHFPLGDTITTQYVNYWGTSPFANAPRASERGTTTSVGSIGGANRFGLFDMSGNVWEWCLDRWHDSYDGAPADGKAWESGGSSNTHVLRGGSWYDSASYCRSASRGRDTMSVTDRYGFRVVATAQ